MLRKQFLTNPSYPTYFMYGGLLLVFLRTPAAVYGIAEAGSFLSGLLLGLGSLLLVAGLFLRFYQAKQNGTLKTLFFSIGFGIAIVVILMATGLIHTPAFLQNIF